LRLPVIDQAHGFTAAKAALGIGLVLRGGLLFDSFLKISKSLGIWELKQEKHDLSGLDALRGVAILGVIVGHFFGAFIPPLVEKLCATGGVMLFFLLSGFLIDRTFNKEPDVLSYLTRRLLRIWPMYAVTVVLIAATDPKWALADVAENLIFSAAFQNTMSGVFWTLYVEILFYLLAPLAILSGRVGLIVAPLLVIARFAYGCAFDAPSSPMWFFLVYCFLGLQVGATWRGVLRADIFVASIAIVGLAAGFFSLGSWQTPLTFLCAAALFAALKFNPKIALLSFCGRVSYSWYLLHPLFGYSIGWWAVSNLHLPQTIGLAFGAGFMLVLAAITYYLIELPAIRLGKAAIVFMPLRIDLCDSESQTGSRHQSPK
jgi:peptidoglycan/LPS O-acetylase OafA/YrhL